MERRELIKMVTLATGAVLSAPLASSILSGCKPKVPAMDADYTLQFFTQEQFNNLRILMDAILPETDTPSASSLGVHRIIDNMVGSAYRPAAKEEYKISSDAFFKHLNEVGTDDINAMAKQLENETDENMSAVKKGWLNIKQQTVAYYLLTEEIGEKHLNYLPVPGTFEPCTNLSETNGKAWSL